MIIIALIGFEKAIISVPKVSGEGVDQLVIDKTGGGTIEASISGISQTKQQYTLQTYLSTFQLKVLAS